MARQILSISDIGSVFINKLNSLFEELYSKHETASYDDRACLNRFVQEMNTKAALLGMTNTTFYDPVGYQPLANPPSGYPQAYTSANANAMTAMDALRMIVYASGIQHLNDAWNIQSFTLNYRNGTTAKTATITSSVFTSSTYQSSIDALLASYDILGGKTGTWGFSPYNAYNLVIIARSKTTGKVYAVADLSTSTANSASDNRFKDVKKALDKVDASGADPSFNKGGCCVCELPGITPSLVNRADLGVLYSYGPTTSKHPASVTKVMTATLLCDNVLDLNQQVTVHEGDRLPDSPHDLVAGDVLTLRDLLNTAMTESNNTSAMTIARVVGGILLDRDANVME